MKISSWSRIFSCPTYSSSCFGRKARSIASSLCEMGAASMMRCSVKISVWMLMRYQPFDSAFSASLMPSDTPLLAGTFFTAAIASLSE